MTLWQKFGVPPKYLFGIVLMPDVDAIDECFAKLPKTDIVEGGIK